MIQSEMNAEKHTHRVAWGCKGSRGGGTEPPQSPEWGWEGPSHVPGLHPDSEAPQTLFQLEGHVHPKAALSDGWEKSTSPLTPRGPPHPVIVVLGPEHRGESSRKSLKKTPRDGVSYSDLCLPVALWDPGERPLSQSGLPE